jgi:hypothetical protein
VQMSPRIGRNQLAYKYKQQPNRYVADAYFHLFTDKR